MGSLLESVRGIGRDASMPKDLPARVAVVTSTYRSRPTLAHAECVVVTFAVLRARLRTEGYQAEGFSTWDAEAEGRDALTRRVIDADLVVGSDLLGSHYRVWDRVVDIDPVMARTADIFLSLYGPHRERSARRSGSSDLTRGALGHPRGPSSAARAGRSPSQALWDDVTLTLTLWERAVRLRAVPVSGGSLQVDDVAMGELTGRGPRFHTRGDWADHVGHLDVAPAEEGGGQSTLREGSEVAVRSSSSVPSTVLPNP